MPHWSNHDRVETSLCEIRQEDELTGYSAVQGPMIHFSRLVTGPMMDMIM